MGLTQMGKRENSSLYLKIKYFVPIKTLQYVRLWQYFTVAVDILILFTVMNCSNVCLPPPLHILFLVKNLRSFLTPWNKVLLQKLTGSQLIMKFPAFYGT
jgi:hypothetical protein